MFLVVIVVLVLVLFVVMMVVVVELAILAASLLFHRQEEIGVHISNLVQVECANVEDLLNIDHAPHSGNDLGDFIDGTDTVLNLFKLLLRHEIGLVQENAIGESHLLNRFVDSAVRLLLIKMLDERSEV